MSDDECDTVAKEVARAARERHCSPIISVSSESTYTAVRHSRMAEGAGASALMAIPPLAASIDETELIRYSGALLAATELPVIVQDASGYIGQTDGCHGASPHVHHVRLPSYVQAGGRADQTAALGAAGRHLTESLRRDRRPRPRRQLPSRHRRHHAWRRRLLGHCAPLASAHRATSKGRTGSTVFSCRSSRFRPVSTLFWPWRSTCSSSRASSRARCGGGRRLPPRRGEAGRGRPPLFVSLQEACGLSEVVSHA